MRAIIAFVFVFIFSSCAFAQTTEERLQELERTMKKQDQSIQELKALQKTVKQQEQTIGEQRKLIEKLAAKTEAATTCDGACARGCGSASENERGRGGSSRWRS